MNCAAHRESRVCILWKLRYQLVQFFLAPADDIYFVCSVFRQSRGHHLSNSWLVRQSISICVGLCRSCSFERERIRTGASSRDNSNKAVYIEQIAYSHGALHVERQEWRIMEMENQAGLENDKLQGQASHTFRAAQLCPEGSIIYCRVKGWKER